MPNDALVPSEVAAMILGVDRATLRGWQRSGFGPRFIEHGDGGTTRCLYRVPDLQEWLARHAFDLCSAARAGNT